MNSFLSEKPCEQAEKLTALGEGHVEAGTRKELRLNPEQQRIVGNVPPRFRGLIGKAVTGNASPRQAIRAKCYECMGFEDASKRVDTCSAVCCPLHKYRPRRRVSIETKEES